ncbi:uracil-DNA glycosylase family protein [Sphingomonas arenae]|uniref:uracil-DNA glycosylase family protein n=1 Tax=Sphingomonas arenae TaxID=2812555 RepID=UPI0019671EFA|nr:uracil-DNA glycosylase family protein [Sphingomonas arenae]
MTKAEAASLLGWWLDAGVDVPAADQPRQWFGRAALIPATSEPGPADEDQRAPQASTHSAASLESLEAFQDHLRQASDLPLFSATSARALPHGPADAEIMLVSDLPARECASEGRPIGGEAWALTVRMLAATGIKPEQAYVASLACFFAPASQLGPRELERCAEDMRHHISLVKPKRLLLLGESPARALIGQPLLHARGRVHRIAGLPAVATLHPRQLLQRPSDKAYAWRDLLLLMDEEVS